MSLLLLSVFFKLVIDVLLLKDMSVINIEIIVNMSKNI